MAKTHASCPASQFYAAREDNEDSAEEELYLFARRKLPPLDAFIPAIHNLEWWETMLHRASFSEITDCDVFAIWDDKRRIDEHVDCARLHQYVSDPFVTRLSPH